MNTKILKLLLIFGCCRTTIFGQNIVLYHPVADAFPLVQTGQAACIYVDPKAEWLVWHAAQLLQEDIERVTDAKPQLVTSPEAAQGRPLVIIRSNNSGSWEAFKISTIPEGKSVAPAPATAQSTSYAAANSQSPARSTGPILEITGSDRRGTAYGIFELSRQIGVSPWYWWADVPEKKMKSIYIRPGTFDFHSPSVKYRGIFINDEAPAFSRWAKSSFGGINHLVYERIFELLLRCKANYLWPAMWGSAFNTDDTLSPVMADKWGIVMGTSHHEPMLRAQAEWKRFGTGPWDYTKNAPVLRAFWRTGIEHMGQHESIVTIGMRGDGDMPMTAGTATSLLEKIVADQRSIIANVTGKPADKTPQLWAIYKEVQDYYDKGMRVPDDVTLLLCDDNWGNIRRLPDPAAPPRPGGYGIYYHFDYVGGPRNYKWINTNNLARVWEQMHLAYQYNARQIWIVNVGDLKPMELPISFFLDYAWHAGDWGDQPPADYYKLWAEEQFGPAQASAIGDILKNYSQWIARKKPELMDAATYTIHEWPQIRANWDSLEKMAMAAGQKLPGEYQDAYYQLVLHPVRAVANLHRLYAAVALNQFYARAQDPRANAYADSAAYFFGEDTAISAAYHRVAFGKWNHMMDQTHIGYTNWQEPILQVMPTVTRIPNTKSATAIPIANADVRNQLVQSARLRNATSGQDLPLTIQATHFTHKTEAPGLHWQIIPGIGLDGDGITTFPVTKTIIQPDTYLEYEFETQPSDSIDISVYCSPTLNFLHDSAGLQVGLSLDDGPIGWTSINAEETNTRTWEKWVANNCIVSASKHSLKNQQRHTIRIYAQSPGIILQKIIINTDPSSNN